MEIMNSERASFPETEGKIENSGGSLQGDDGAQQCDHESIESSVIEAVAENGWVFVGVREIAVSVYHGREGLAGLSVNRTDEKEENEIAGMREAADIIRERSGG